VYVSFPEGILWKANRDGTNPVQLTDPPWHPFLPQWSPDSSQILFSQKDSGKPSRSYIVSSQGGAPQSLLPEDKEDQSDPSWSPDGRKIVFGSQEFEAGKVTDVIKVLDRSTHQIVTLPGSHHLFSPRWSPDGRFIAGITVIGDRLTIFDFETRRWSETQEVAFSPTWSRDGRFIYFVGGERVSGKDSGVFRVRVSGGNAERVVDLNGFRLAGWMGLDPQDRPMLMRDVGTEDVYAITLEQK
jgi:Tol biopolymer transport system component